MLPLSLVNNQTGESARSVSASSQWVSGLFMMCGRVCVLVGKYAVGFTLFDEYIYIYDINGFYINDFNVFDGKYSSILAIQIIFEEQ